MVVSRLNWWHFSAFCCLSFFPTAFFLFTSCTELQGSTDACCQIVSMLQCRDGCISVMSKVIISLYPSSKNHVWFSKLWDLWMKDAISSAKQFSLPQTKMKLLAFHVSLRPLITCHFPLAIFSFQILTLWQPSYFQKLLSKFEIVNFLLGIFSKQAFCYLNFSKLTSRFRDRTLLTFFFFCHKTRS